MAGPNPSILRLKITLLGLRPPVWRRLLVAESMTLARLHLAIQAAMGWQGAHLYQFEIDGGYFGDPEMLNGVADDGKGRLARLVRQEVGRFRYLYSMSDNWDHEVLVESREPPFSGERYPTCVGGRRACPPENIGGSAHYQRLLDGLATADHPELTASRDRLGHDFDPATFSVEAAEERLRVAFPSTGRPGVPERPVLRRKMRYARPPTARP